MCTVTFIPGTGSRVLTSNRDEQVLRAPARLPEVVSFPGGRILFPADGQAGGTWIASHENGNAMVLLNGAFEAHLRLPPYRKSRGLVFLDIIDGARPSRNFETTDLHRIEPFTLVILEAGTLLEARWDGQSRHLKALEPNRPYIWSSVTLYDAAVRRKRAVCFETWLELHPEPTAADIRLFHAFAGDGDEATALRMSRDGMLRTVSITGISLSDAGTEMHYRDLRTGLSSIHTWPPSPQPLC